jgi:hypothetical protein
VLLLVFAVPDYAATGPDFSFWVLTVLPRGDGRAVASRPEKRCGARPSWGSRAIVLMWLGLLGYPLFFLFYALRPDIRAINTGMIMVIQITLFLFCRCASSWRCPWRCLARLAPRPACGPPAAWTCHQGGHRFFGADASGGGLRHALRQQKTERQEFWLRQQLQDANRELQGEVAAPGGPAGRAGAPSLHRPTHRPAQPPCAGVSALRSKRRVAQRSGEALSLAMFDLDHFKR